MESDAGPLGKRDNRRAAGLEAYAYRASALPPFNWEAFVRRMGNNRELCKRVLGVFMQDTPRQLALLNQAAANFDLSEAQRAAHSIKGAAASIGAEAIHRAAYDIETAARDGSIKEVRERLPELEWTFASFLEAIARNSLTE